MHEDCHYIEGLLANDSKKVNMLYSNYFPLACKIVVESKGSTEDAHDVFQDAVMAIFRKAEQVGGCFLENTKLSTYLYVLCRNLWLAKLRRLGRNVSGDVINDQLMLSIDESPPKSVEDECIDMEQRDRLWGIVGKMEEACRDLLVLYANGEKHKEIAEKLGLKVNEIGVKVQRCLSKLRAHF